MEVLESPPGDIPSQPATEGGNAHEPHPGTVPGQPKSEGGIVQTEEATGIVTPTPPTPSEGDVSKATDELADENHADAATSLEQADAKEERLTAEADESNKLNPEANGSDSSVSASRRSSVSLAGSALKRPEDEENETKANELFTKKHGIIYVPDKFYAKMSPWARHCHIYVSANDGGNPLEGQKKTAVLASQDAPPHVIPPRMTIINQRLMRDLQLSGFTLDCNFNFHLAPYRILVYYESEIKARHQRLEKEFALLSLEHPDHGAVLRKEEFLHPQLAFGVKRFGVSLAYDGYDDDVGKARTLLDGYRALTQFFDTDLQGLVENCRKIRANSVEALPFSHLWFLFALHRTTPIIAGDQAYRVLQIRGGRATTSDGKHADESYDTQGASRTRWTMSNLEIDCFFIDFDGKELGPVIHKIQIRPYDGLRKITNLPAYPISFNTDRTTIAGAPAGEDEKISLTEALRRRGQSFERIIQECHWRYKGLSLREPGQFEVREEIDSDVMVDLELAYRTETRIRAPVFWGPADTVLPNEENLEGEPSSYDFEANLTLEDLWKDSVDPELLKKQALGSLVDDVYMILPAKTYGYVLFRRKWYPLSVDLITEVPFVAPGGGDGFGKLVLPPGHKDIVRALVKTHTRRLDADGGASTGDSHREYDLVKGKGRGLIILLHGAPGVGKTSTAECVAANAGRPLFHITCGDIGGNSAQEVEANLDRFFDLAGKWNCVLLLDEADVFLSARQSGNIKQSSLVSVFLRVLEYYPGILILTTNRVGNFDEAIKSRVHCALYYPPLDYDRTYKVWKMNLKALEERNEKVDEKFRVRFKATEIKAFARNHWDKCKDHERWNGRQIKNAFQTAVALAEWRMLKRTHKSTGKDQDPIAPELTWDDFDKVAIASKHFDMYLTSVRESDDARARQLQFRDDSITNKIPEGNSIATTTKPTKGKTKGRKPRVGNKKGRGKRLEVDEDDEDETEDDDSETGGDGSETEEGSEETDSGLENTEDESEDEGVTEEDSSGSDGEAPKRKPSKGKSKGGKDARISKTKRRQRGKNENGSRVSKNDASHESDEEVSSEEENDEPRPSRKEKKAAAGKDKKKVRKG